MPQTRKHSTNAERQAVYRAKAREAHNEQLRAKGLPPLPVLPTVPSSRRWRAALERTIHLLATVASEKATYNDDRSESWQESERGDDFRERLEVVTDLQQQAEECLEDWK